MAAFSRGSWVASAAVALAAGLALPCFAQGPVRGSAPATPAETQVASIPPETPYWEDRQRGWFFYEIVREMERRRREEADRALEASPSPSQEPAAPPAVELTREYLDGLTIRQLRALGEWAKERAVERPTTENVKRYVHVQRYYIDKSQQFANAWTLVMLENPEMNEASYSPVSQAGSDLRMDLEERLSEGHVRSLSSRSALIVFYRSDCEYCKRQYEILTFFKRKYPEFHLEFVNVEGESSLRTSFEVDTVPDTWILYRNEDDSPFYYRVYTGLVTLQQLEDTISFIDVNVIRNPQINTRYRGKPVEDAPNVERRMMSLKGAEGR